MVGGRDDLEEVGLVTSAEAIFSTHTYEGIDSAGINRLVRQSMRRYFSFK